MPDLMGDSVLDVGINNLNRTCARASVYGIDMAFDMLGVNYSIIQVVGCPLIGISKDDSFRMQIFSDSHRFLGRIGAHRPVGARLGWGDCMGYDPAPFTRLGHVDKLQWIKIIRIPWQRDVAVKVNHSILVKVDRLSSHQDDKEVSYRRIGVDSCYSVKKDDPIVLLLVGKPVEIRILGRRLTRDYGEGQSNYQQQGQANLCLYPKFRKYRPYEELI